jgi:integrase
MTKKKKKGKGGRKAAWRAKGTGSLERHGRTWRAVWFVDGKRHVKSTGTSDKDAALAKMKEFIKPYHTEIEAVQAAKAAQAAKRSGMKDAAKALAETAKAKRAEAGRLTVTIKKAWEAFNSSLARGTISASTARTYAGRWASFEKWMEETHPDAVSLADVDDETAQAFMRGIKKNYSPKTYNEYRALLWMVWRTLDKEAGLDGFNPWNRESIKPLEKETHSRKVLTEEELARVVAPLTGEMRVLFAVGTFTGLRLGDAVTLKWEAVNLRQNFIVCKPSKTRKHGTVVQIPLADALAAILLETPPSERKGWIMPELAAEYAGTTYTDEDGNEIRKPGYPQYTARRIQKAFEDAGIVTQSDVKGRSRKAVDFGFHSLRHGFVSYAGNAGVPLAIVKSLVGHVSEEMTKKYFHANADALRGAVKALPNVFGKKSLPSGDVIDVDARDVPVEGRPALPPASIPPDVLRAILDGLEGMKAGNWRKVRDELVGKVREALGEKEQA